MKRTVAAIAIAVAGMSAVAKTNYVDCMLGDYTGHNGRSWENAFETIQQAIDASLSGDTILVKPGVYDKGEGKAVESWGRSRIGWNNKSIYIISTDGPEVTHIVGRKSTDANADANGIGNNAIRIVSVYNVNSSTAASLLKGFTLRDGATVSDYTTVTNALGSNKKDTGGYVGQVYAEYGGMGCFSHSSFVVSDCVISNCAGKSYGIGYLGTYVRCRITENAAENDLISGNGAQMYASVVTRNFNPVEGAEGGTMMGAGVKVFNSTLIDNAYETATPLRGEFRNVIFHNTGVLMAASEALEYSGCVSESSDSYPVMNTIDIDYRVRAGSLAETAGDAAGLAGFTLPEGMAEMIGLHDFDGNTLPESGAVAAGATQTVQTPAGGGIYVAWNAPTLIDGKRAKRRKQVSSYVFPSVYPTQYLFTAVNTDPSLRLCYFHFKDNSAKSYDYRFPMRDDGLYVMPPSDPEVVITNDYTTVGSKIYISPTADAAVADGSYDKPYRKIMDAVKKHGGNVVYIAKPGTYTEDGEYIEVAGKGRSRLFLENVCRITSECGPEATFLVGAKDESAEADAYGCGPNAVRAYFTNSNMQQLQGFTITGCYSGLSGDAAYGAVYGNSHLYLSDCIVTNNYAGEGAAAFNTIVERCYISENRGENGILSNTRLIASVVKGNYLGDKTYGVVREGYVAHSYVEGSMDEGYFAHTANCRRYASVFRNCYSASATGSGEGCVYDNFRVLGNVAGALAADSLLADPDGGDYHPMKDSPVFSWGARPQVGNYGGYYWFLARSDYEGKRIAFNGEGVPRVGAFMTPTDRRIVAVFADKGGVAPQGSRIEVGADGKCTFAVGAGTRPCVGVAVNSVTNLFAGSSVSVAVPEGGVKVEAVYTSFWYAAPDGDDNADGFSPLTPKTLKGALGNVNLIEGDTVWATNGVYEGEVMVQNDSAGIPARAVVPKGVTLKSMAGAADTIIKGRASDVVDAVGTFSESARAGLGKNAIRCAYLNAGASLEGFTLLGGHTRGADDDGKTYHGSADYCGGGAYGEDHNWYVRNCIFDGCAAYRGGGSLRGRIYNSVYRNCRAIYGGGGASDVYAYGCLSHGNYSATAGQYAGFFYFYHLENCTSLDGSGNMRNTSAKAVNNLFIGTTVKEASMTVDNTVNCIFNSAWVDASAFEGYTGIRVASADMLQMENLRPVVGYNVAVDAYSAAAATYEADATDALGGQRVYNGAMDVGATEADWRPLYAKDLAPRRITVSEATENVVESSSGTVLIAAGEKLIAEWRGNTSGTELEYSFKANVAEGALLKVFMNGGETPAFEIAGDGSEKTLEFKNSELVNAMRFECEGESGAAEIYAFSRACPTVMMIVR